MPQSQVTIPVNQDGASLFDMGFALDDHGKTGGRVVIVGSKTKRTAVLKHVRDELNKILGDN